MSRASQISCWTMLLRNAPDRRSPPIRPTSTPTSCRSSASTATAATTTKTPKAAWSWRTSPRPQGGRQRRRTRPRQERDSRLWKMLAAASNRRCPRRTSPPRSRRSSPLFARGSMPARRPRRQARGTRHADRPPDGASPRADHIAGSRSERPLGRRRPPERHRDPQRLRKETGRDPDRPCRRHHRGQLLRRQRTARRRRGRSGARRRSHSLENRRLVPRRRVFRGHRDALYSAQLSPERGATATSGYDKQILLWDVATGQKQQTLAGHNDAVYSLAFHPAGKLLASASGDRTVKLWDVVSGERLDTFRSPRKSRATVAASPDGRLIVAGGADNRIRVWEITDTAKEGTNPIRYARFAHETPSYAPIRRGRKTARLVLRRPADQALGDRHLHARVAHPGPPVPIGPPPFASPRQPPALRRPINSNWKPTT